MELVPGRLICNGLMWRGEDLASSDEPVSLELETELLSDEEIVITTNFLAPSSVATYESVWQLIDADEVAYGQPITFTIRTYVPFTPTPEATATPAATATSEVEISELNYISESFELYV